nr:hypothetical protein FFPRI1PSEUD_59490 [Pseudomonas sp. FFPRI_1]
MRPGDFMSRSMIVPGIAVFLGLCAQPQASAVEGEEWLKGRMHMSGSIFDAACAIRIDNQYQAIRMMPTPIHGLVNGEASTQQPLTISIINCGSSNARVNDSVFKSFALVFEGDGNGQYFITQGTAKGIAIQIKDQFGNLVIPGVPLKGNEVIARNRALNYSLTLAGSGSALNAGDYHATIRLRIHHF